jgi:hypothetical protein
MASLSIGVHGRGLRAFAWVRGGRVVLGGDGGRNPLARAEGQGDSRRRTHGEQIPGRLTWAGVRLCRVPTASGERKAESRTCGGDGVAPRRRPTVQHLFAEAAGGFPPPCRAVASAERCSCR